MFEIGNSLREARLRRQGDFNQAELATKIRVKYLRALEEERFDELPSQTYVKGFLRTYAEYLGLDGQLYVDEFNSRFVAGEDSDTRPRRSSVRPERRNRRLETFIVLLVVVTVAVVTLIVTAAWQSGGSGPKAGTPPKSPPVTRKHHTSAPVPFLQIKAVNGGSYVAVHLTGPTGRLLFQGTIEQGRTEPFDGKYFWLSVSSPENLSIVVKGKRIPLSGGKPVTLTVTPNGVQPA